MGPHVFLSHAGEQKKGPVSYLHKALAQLYPHHQRDSVRVEDCIFLDEFSKAVGAHGADVIASALESAAVVVVVMSWEYVRKARCMQELAALVTRWNRERGQEGALLVVPWFADARIPFEECASLRAKYDSDTEWPSSETKPPPATLDGYAKTVQDFCHIVALRGDKENGFRGEQMERVVRIVKQHLLKRKLLLPPHPAPHQVLQSAGLQPPRYGGGLPAKALISVEGCKVCFGRPSGGNMQFDDCSRCLAHGRLSSIRAETGLTLGALHTTYGSGPSQRHGASNPSTHPPFDVAPDDCITRVDGYLLRGEMLQHLVFYTRRGRWGSFGAIQEARPRSFSARAPEGCCVGYLSGEFVADGKLLCGGDARTYCSHLAVHWVRAGAAAGGGGLDSGGSELYSRGAEQFDQTGFYGRSLYGDTFDDAPLFHKHGRISRLQLRVGALVDQLAVSYGDAAAAAQHGGGGGERCDAFALEGGERVIKVGLKMDAWCDLKSMAFHTNMGRVYDPRPEPADVASEVEVEAPEGWSLGFVRGVVDVGGIEKLACLQLVWARDE